MSIFTKRTAYKPFEYPEILNYTEAINKSFWVHSEIDFTADIQDFHSHLSPNEKEIIKRCLLAIAQIEVNVKSFWGNLYNHLPKPEFNGLGATFAECEFRHSEAYSRLLEVLGYSNAFENVVNIPCINDRIKYLTDATQFAKSDDQSNYIQSLILFSLLIENVSLFSQFAIILSFTRFKGVMKNVSNIIAWTSVDEQIHANAGMYIINKINEEFPDMLTYEKRTEIINIVKNSFEVESQILDWIFENGELEFMSKAQLLEFMKARINQSLIKIDFEKVFETNSNLVQSMQWFDEEILAPSLDDFFAKRPVEYTKHDKSISADDLF